MGTRPNRQQTATPGSRARTRIIHARILALHEGQRHRRVRFNHAAMALLLLGALQAMLAPGAMARAGAPATGLFAPTGPMRVAQLGPAVLLPNGQVLVAGGCTTSSGSSGHLAVSELYNPSTGAWRVTGSMAIGRCGHTLTLLPNGQVLAAGGSDSYGNLLASAELYNPATGTWRTTGGMNYARSVATATLLPDGQVLVAGGYINGASTLSTAELYDPHTGIWRVTGSMTMGREWFTATLLANGTVLAVGGLSVCVPFNCNPVSSAELYDPNTGGWTATGSLPAGLYNQTAALLASGKVLVVGGSNQSCNNGCPPSAGAELYDPATGTWTATGSLHTPREFHTETVLPDDMALVTGGIDNANDTLTSAELYNPGSGAWTATGSMRGARSYQSATLLLNGTVLVAGGCTISNNMCATTLASAELYTTQAVASISLAPNSGAAGSSTTVAGTGFGPFETVLLKLYCSSPTCSSHTVLGTATTDASGAFSQSVTIPATASAGGHEVGAIGQSSGTFADRTFTVTP